MVFFYRSWVYMTVLLSYCFCYFTIIIIISIIIIIVWLHIIYRLKWLHRLWQRVSPSSPPHLCPVHHHLSMTHVVLKTHGPTCSLRPSLVLSYLSLVKPYHFYTSDHHKFQIFTLNSPIDPFPIPFLNLPQLPLILFLHQHRSLTGLLLVTTKG